MNDNDRNIVQSATNIVATIALIDGVFVLISLLAGRILTAVIMGVMLWLELWVFFKLLHSYERVLHEVETHTTQIKKLKKQLHTLEDRLRWDEKPLESSMQRQQSDSTD